MVEKHATGARIALTTVVMVTAIALAGCATRAGPDRHYSHYRTPAPVWYDYYYYPDQQVYFEISSGYYWLHDHDRWQRVRYLPSHLRLHEHERVHIRLDTDRPHRHAAEHRERYRHRPAYQAPGHQGSAGAGENRRKLHPAERRDGRVGERGRAQDRTDRGARHAGYPRTDARKPARDGTRHTPRQTAGSPAGSRGKVQSREATGARPASSHEPRRRDAGDRAETPRQQRGAGRAAAPERGRRERDGAGHDGRRGPAKGEVTRGAGHRPAAGRRGDVSADAEHRDGRRGRTRAHSRPEAGDRGGTTRGERAAGLR